MKNFEWLRNFHDAKLRHILHIADINCLELGFEIDNGKLVTISLHGLVNFRVVDFCIQNVVSGLFIQSVNLKLSRNELIDRIWWMLSNCDGDLLTDEVTVNILTQRVELNNLLLFILEPSWGAEVIVLAEKCYFMNKASIT
jgi:hypothetical protein